MRKAAAIGIPVAAVAVACGLWFGLHGGDPIAAAKREMARSNMRGAEQYLRQAIRRHPDSPEAAFLLGEVDLALGNPQGAELELRRAQDRGYPRAPAVLPLGQAYLEQRHFNQVLADFTEAHAPPGARGDVLTIRAAAQISLGDVRGAQATIAQAEAASPNAHQTLLTAARIAMETGDIDGAAARAAKILAAEPNQPDAKLLQAEIAMRRNDPAAALSLAQSVLAATPVRLDARLIEARAEAALGQPDQARGSLRRVLAGAPQNVSANFLGAMLAVQQGDYASADAMLTRISTMLGDLPHGFYFLAVTKLGLGQPAQAEEAATKFLARKPDDVGGLKLLAFIDLARRHPEETLALLRDSKLAQLTDADTLDLQGRALAMRGDLKAAQADFSRAATLAPRDVQILNRLAASELSLGDTRAAEAELTRSLAISPNQRLAGEAIVQAALARGDVGTATRDVEQLRARIGDAEEVGVLAAQVRIAGLDMDGAEAQLHDVLRRFPDSRAATLSLVRIYGLRGEEAQAEQLLEDLLHRHPDDLGALNVLLPSLFAERRPDRAVAIAEAAHAAAPGDVGITAALAGAYVRAKQTTRAVALLDRASAGTDPQLELLRARVLASDGQTDQAEQVYHAALRDAPGDVRMRAELAALLVRAKRPEDARDAVREGLQASPGNPLLLGALVGIDLKNGGVQAALATAAELCRNPQNLPAARSLAGDALVSAGETPRAAAAFLAAYKANPSAELAGKTATALSKAGHDDQAIALLTAWTAQHPDDAASLSVLGSLEITAGRLAEADRYLTTVLTLRPPDTATLNNLAWLKQQEGDAAAARVLAERAYFQAPAPEVADTLGWILARQGDTAQALPLLSQAAAIQQGPSAAPTAYHYAWVLNAVGRRDEAKRELAVSLSPASTFPEKKDAETLMGSLK